jgi:hypothetical protein
MSKDTKKIIARTLLTISSENGKMTINEISKRSHITRTTIMNNFNTGIPGIFEYIYLNIVNEINEAIFRYKIEELSLEIFSNILLSILWNHKEEVRIINTTHIPFNITGPISDKTWSWAEARFNKLAKDHGLFPYFSGKDLLNYYNTQLIAIITLWLGTSIPIEPSIFQHTFLLLTSNSIKSLIYKDIEDVDK